jgi:hypothetical protein
VEAVEVVGPGGGDPRARLLARSWVTGAFSAETTCVSRVRSTLNQEATEVTTSLAINARGHSAHKERKPIRRRVTELPQFVVNRGGEYFFMPGLRALRWLAELDT